MSGKPPTFTPEQQIGLLFKQLMHAFRHDIDQRLRHHGDLSFAHVATLGQVEETPGLPGAQLARRLFVTAQTLTGLLRRLEQDGYLLRRPHPHNRRADCWFLSTTGERQLHEARGVMAPVVTQMLSQLAPDEVESLRGMLQRCVLGLEPALRTAPGRDEA